MNVMMLFWIIVSFLVFLLILIGLFAFIDWRALIIRKFGPSYKKGLAHIQIDDAWFYRESELVYQGDDAMTYSREVEIDGQKVIFNDIVPNAIGFSYDEYTGRRQYRVNPGGVIGYSDDGDAPAVDYPSALISCHVLDRTVSNYASSVNAESEFNWKLILYGAIAGAILIAVVLYFGGILKIPSTQPVNEEESKPTQTAPLQPGHEISVKPAGGE